MLLKLIAVAAALAGLLGVTSCMALQQQQRGTTWTDHRTIYEDVDKDELWEAAVKVLLRLGFEIEQMDRIGEYVITKPMLTKDPEFVWGENPTNREIQLKVVLWVKQPAPRIGIVEIMLSSAKIIDGVRTRVKSSGRMEMFIKDGIGFEVGTLRGDRQRGI